MPERVNRAIWRMAYAPCLRWADLVLSFVNSGLEALLTVEETKLGKLAEVALIQDLLRKAVRCCVEDAEFRSVFTDDALIRGRWWT